jgi:hypothetical protein
MLVSTKLPVAGGQEALEVADGIDAVLACLRRRTCWSCSSPRTSFSGHHVHVEQPLLVTDAIRAVVNVVRETLITP